MKQILILLLFVLVGCGSQRSVLHQRKVYQEYRDTDTLDDLYRILADSSFVRRNLDEHVVREVTHYDTVGRKISTTKEVIDRTDNRTKQNRIAQAEKKTHIGHAEAALQQSDTISYVVDKKESTQLQQASNLVKWVFFLCLIALIAYGVYQLKKYL